MARDAGSAHVNVGALIFWEQVWAPFTDEELRYYREEQEAELRAENAWLRHAEDGGVEAELDLADDDANGFCAWGFPDPGEGSEAAEACRTCGDPDCYRPEGHPLDEYDDDLYVEDSFAYRRWLETHPLR